MIWTRNGRLVRQVLWVSEPRNQVAVLLHGDPERIQRVFTLPHLSATYGIWEIRKAARLLRTRSKR